MMRMMESLGYLTGAASTGVSLAAGGWYFAPGFAGGWPDVTTDPFGAPALLIDSAGIPLINIFGGTAVSGVIGARLKINAGQTGVLTLGFFDSATGLMQACVTFTQTGAVKAYRGSAYGTLLATTAGGQFRLGAWFWVEVKGLIDPSAGTIDVRINTVPVMTLSSQDTQGSSGPTFDAVAMGSFATGGDDPALNSAIGGPWFLDLTGEVNNDFLGNTKYTMQVTDGAGASTQFTPEGAATNWQAAQNFALSDASYNVSDTPGDIDLYDMSASVTMPTAFAVQVRTALRQDDATQVMACNVLKSGSTEVLGASFPTNETYTFDKDIWELDPHTGLGWSASGVNALQAGVKLISIA